MERTISTDIKSSFNIERTIAAGDGLVQTKILERMAKAFEKDSEIRDDIKDVEAIQVPGYTRRQVHEEMQDLGVNELEELLKINEEEPEAPETPLQVQMAVEAPTPKDTVNAHWEQEVQKPVQVVELPKQTVQEAPKQAQEVKKPVEA